MTRRARSSFPVLTRSAGTSPKWSWKILSWTAESSPRRFKKWWKKPKLKFKKKKTTRAAGEKAAYEAGIFDVDPRLGMLLGRLKFRTSYGQNVLQHSIEMAHLAGMLASELGGDVAIAKKGALLHDIGKAVDHEIQGTHVRSEE